MSAETSSSCGQKYYKEDHQDDRPVLHLLENLQVRRVDRIELHQRISSQGFDVTKTTQDVLYLDEKSGRLTLYLPYEEVEMETVYSYYLPQRLMEFLHIDD